MLFGIQLLLDSVLAQSDIEVFIDHCAVDFTIEDQYIAIEADCGGFIHTLELRTKVSKRFQIKQVKIGDCDLRKLIFLSYVQTAQGEYHQPATELWEANQRWILPFGYPVSGWLSTVEHKIPNGKLGQNLLEHYRLYYPDSKTIDKGFPQIIRDFFQYNFDFTVLDKSNTDVAKIPFLDYKKSISSQLIDRAKKEIVDQTEFILSTGLEYGQREYNVKEFQNLTQENSWHIVWLKRHNQLTDLAKKFPKVCELIDSLDINYWQSFIGVLPPSAFIYPHCDLTPLKIDNRDYDDYRGCTQLYIPVQWPSKNYIKFAGVGTLCLESGQPMVINSDYFTHCLVNASQENRIVLGVRYHKNIVDDCDFTRQIYL